MHISIIEDNKLLAINLKKWLESNWFCVSLYFSYQDFMKNTNFNTDTFIIDLNLWDWSWFDLINYIRNEKKLDIPIIITSVSDDDEKKVYWFDIWADDFISKKFSLEELVARIRAIIRRKNNWNTTSIIDYWNFAYHLKSKKLMSNNKYIHLTNIESKIVYFFLINKWRIISKICLINSIWWDKEWTWVSDNTINVTISKIRKKLWDDFKLLTRSSEWYILE